MEVRPWFVIWIVTGVVLIEWLIIVIVLTPFLAGEWVWLKVKGIK